MKEEEKKIPDADREKRYQISEDFVLRQIGGEYAIIPIGEVSSISNAVMSPNDSAVFLWKQFMEPNSEEKVAAKVLEEYEAPAEKSKGRCTPLYPGVAEETDFKGGRLKWKENGKHQEFWYRDLKRTSI